MQTNILSQHAVVKGSLVYGNHNIGKMVMNLRLRNGLWRTKFVCVFICLPLKCSKFAKSSKPNEIHDFRIQCNQSIDSMDRMESEQWFANS